MDYKLSKIPLYSDEGECGYFSERKSTTLLTRVDWYNQHNDCKVDEKKFFTFLMETGFRRNGQYFYVDQCKGCRQCVPIRVPVKDFKASKSQRAVWRKNQDVEVRLEKNPEKFVTDEKVFMLREYDFHHNGKRKSMDETRELLSEALCGGYSGIWNLEFYVEGKLAGVSILDYGEDETGQICAISSNYFYYDVSQPVLKRSLGVFSVLKEIELCRELGVQYYYLGLYLSDCRKMNYKTNYKPYELYLNEKWVLMPEDSDSVLNEDLIIRFPKPGELFRHPDIVCVTDDMPLQYLYSAYMQGIFPWFNEDDGDPVLWQCPEKRFVILPEDFHVAKSIEKFLKKNPFTYTVDKCFDEVIEKCSEQERAGQNGTWIGPMIKKAYKKFHKAGYAHSVEVWHDGKLAGGFYGELIGSVFFGESMFTLESESSKTAFVLFARNFFANGGKMIDCQAYTDNMARYGAKEISREDFLTRLNELKNIDVDWKTISVLKQLLHPLEEQD